MNLLQLVFKQMRQRALSTWLTMLSVVLGVGLAIAILVFQREGGRLFEQSDFGYDTIIGVKGNRLQLVLNTAYNLADSQGTIPYSFYEDLPRNLPRNYWAAVQWKVPYAVGDYYEGHRVIGTLTTLFGVDESGQPLSGPSVPEYRVGRRFELASGRVFHPRKFEAVIGATVARNTGLGLGSTFKVQHGSPAPGGYKDEHDEQWEVVGILQPTHTANDRAIFIPLVSFYAIPDHLKGLEQIATVAGVAPSMTASQPADDHAHNDHDHADDADHDHAHDAEHDNPQTGPAAHDAHDHADHDHAAHKHEHAYVLRPDGTIDLRLPPEKWRVSAILVRTRGVLGPGLRWAIDQGPLAMAVNPAMEMRQFFDTFLRGSSNVLLAVSLLVTIVAAVSILVSIYNSVSARRKEIAILRALGATRLRVLTLICVEAALIGVLGGLGGLVVGHLLCAGASAFLQYLLGQGIDWLAFDAREWLYLLVVLVLAVLAGLVPALKAYQTPVATHLVAT